MKLSGQRWTQQGAQQVVNLRVAYKNKQWDKISQQINDSALKYRGLKANEIRQLGLSRLKIAHAKLVETTQVYSKMKLSV
jgi:hypothetical protein